MSEIKRLKQQLEQLEKTRSLGIISEEEYEKGKANIDKKLKPLIEKEQARKKSSKVVDEIISKPKKEPVKKEPAKEQAKQQDIKKESEKPADLPAKKSAEEKPEEKAQEEKVREESKKEKKPQKTRHAKAKPALKKTEKRKEKASPEESDEDKDSDEGFYSRASTWLGLFFIILIIAVFIQMRGPDTASTLTEKNLTGVNKTVDVDLFLSYNCKYSGDLIDTAYKLKKMYGDHIIVRVFHYPLDVKKDLPLDVASQCAMDQNTSKFIEYTDLLTDAEKPLKTEELVRFAADIGLDPIVFLGCMDSNSTVETILGHYQFAKDMGIEKVPAMMIGQDIVTGIQPLSQYELFIDSNLQ